MADTSTGTVAPQPKRAPALPREGLGSLDWWTDQIRASEDKIKKYAPAWKKNVARQIGQPLELTPTVDTVVVPIDHANVEQKKAQLYFQNPDVQLTAAPGHEAKADNLRGFTVVLNEVLGPDGVDAETTMDEMLTDVLCPSGIGMVALGLNVTVDGTKPVIVGYQDVPMAGSVLGLQTTPQPIIEQAPNILHQEYYFSRVSPLYGLLPVRFHGSNFDRAPWLGYKFEMDRAVAMKTLKLTEDEAQKAGDDPDRLNENEKPTGRDTDVVYGYCISYKGSLYNPAVTHPEEIWRVILVKGCERVIVHDRPYQQYAPDGRTLIGLRGHFISVYVPRYVSDTAIPPSDVSMSRNQVDELSRGRSQMVQQRDRARPMRQINISLVDPTQAEKIKHGEYQEIIFTNSNEPIVQEVAHATYPRENFEFNRQIEKDINTAWAFGANQRGLAEETRRTATELSIQENHSDNRMEKERKRLLKWYLRQAEKIGGLIQLFEDEREAVQIAGEGDPEQHVVWDRKALPLRFIAKASLDTMIRTDTASEFKRDLDFYQLTANDPHVNRVELLIPMVRKRGYDPTKVVTRDLPEKGAPKPTISVTVKGEDLNPANPQFPVIQQLIQEGGFTISEENIALGLSLAEKATSMTGTVDPTQAGNGPVAGRPTPDSTHGGAAQQQHPLSKHVSDQTGQLPGGGQAPAVN